jgi:hypothetical protein
MVSKKFIGAVALSSALAAGGVAGALLGTPSVSAAQEDSSSSVDASTASSADTSSSDTSSSDNSTNSESTDSGSDVQGDAAQAKDCPDGPRGHHGPGLAAAAEALGMTEDELKTELESGKSIADVAGEKGVDVQTVIDALVADASAHIDQEVTDGHLTADEAAAKKAELNDRITAFVNGEMPPGGPGGPGGPRHGGPGHHRGEGPAPDANSDSGSTDGSSTSGSSFSGGAAQFSNA